MQEKNKSSPGFSHYVVTILVCAAFPKRTCSHIYIQPISAISLCTTAVQNVREPDYSLFSSFCRQAFSVFAPALHESAKTQQCVRRDSGRSESDVLYLPAAE